ncbi:AMP-binding protein [Belnapia sp. F-4-1]|uniref:AMP-binding protein n=1 Tax=Belnapia sp. F-4-1 TaxID=1545443 RepID=UPI001364A48C|nr:AMP-binding protein [Belnapia sp. F-4-1]
MRPEAALPLVNRGTAEVICYRPAGPMTVGRLLGEARALAARLPATGHAINLCADRYRMLLGFVAALMRGHPTLLNADASPHRLRALAEAYPGAYLLTDKPVASGLPLVLVEDDTAEEWTGPAPMLPARQLAAIAFTSGSTGQPTAHLKPWDALVAAALAAAERFALRPGDGAASSVLATVPPQHMYGFETTIMLPLQAALACHAGEAFFPSDVLDALDALPERRLLVTTPLHLRALLAEHRRPATLAAVISATAPLAMNMAEAVERDWGAPMLEIYGASEAGSMASRRTALEPDWLPYSGIRMGQGDVHVPGLGAVPLTDAVEPAPGGRFRLLGRRADLVKLGGRRASLAELNRVLAEVAGVEDGVFVAPEDIERNPAARLSAYAVAPGRTTEEILAALRLRLEPVFLPRPLVLVPALPRNGLGKLTRAALDGLRLAMAAP